MLCERGVRGQVREEEEVQEVKEVEDWLLDVVTAWTYSRVKLAECQGVIWPDESVA